VLQFAVLRVLRGRRRTTAIVAAVVTIACAWCVAIAAAHAGGGTAAIVGFAVAMVVLALAETLLSPSLAPIVNDLAPDRLRGRYNGVSVLAYTTGFTIGPVLAGVGLTIGDGTDYFALLAVACGVTALGAVALRRRLPAAIDVIDDGRVDAPVLLLEIE
jgi:MFS family permease